VARNPVSNRHQTWGKTRSGVRQHRRGIYRRNHAEDVWFLRFCPIKYSAEGTLASSGHGTCGFAWLLFVHCRPLPITQKTASWSLYRSGGADDRPLLLAHAEWLENLYRA
jgi:hypothetical protein